MLGVRSANDTFCQMMLIEGKDMVAPDLEEAHSLDHNTRANTGYTASEAGAPLPDSEGSHSHDASPDLCEVFGFDFGDVCRDKPLSKTTVTEATGVECV